MKATMTTLVLRCPMLEMCRNSMARICTCEMMGIQVGRGVVLKGKNRECGCERSCVQGRI